MDYSTIHKVFGHPGFRLAPRHSLRRPLSSLWDPLRKEESGKTTPQPMSLDIYSALSKNKCIPNTYQKHVWAQVGSKTHRGNSTGFLLNNHRLDSKINRAWYLFPPFTARQRCIILGSFAISALISSMVILLHSWIKTSFIKLTEVIFSTPLLRRILFFIRVQICSIGLKSGEFGGQSTLVIPSFCRSLLV